VSVRQNMDSVSGVSCCLNTTIHLNSTYLLSPYRAVNTLRLGLKTSQLMLNREIIAVCSEIYTKHINTVCGQNVEFSTESDVVLPLPIYSIVHFL
jgi:hypothetical protein